MEEDDEDEPPGFSQQQRQRQQHRSSSSVDDVVTLKTPQICGGEKLKKHATTTTTSSKSLSSSSSSFSLSRGKGIGRTTEENDEDEEAPMTLFATTEEMLTPSVALSHDLFDAFAFTTLCDEEEEKKNANENDAGGKKRGPLVRVSMFLFERFVPDVMRKLSGGKVEAWARAIEASYGDSID